MIDKIIFEIDLLKVELTRNVQNEEYLKGCENMADSLKTILEKYRKEAK